MPGFETLTVEARDAVLYVGLNRPQRRNAMNPQMLADLVACFEGLTLDDRLRAVCLFGVGKVFCAGADVEWMRAAADLDEDGNRADARRFARMLETLDACPIPLVVRVHGVALGGAMGLLAVADIVVAGEATRFGFTEVRLGIVPAVVSTFVLRKTGEGPVRRYFLSGELFGVEAAQRMNLVHEVVPEEDLDEGLARLLEPFLQVGPQAVREAKALMRRLRDLPRAGRLDHCVATLARIRVTPEAQEGLAAFLERRRPRFAMPHPEAENG